MGSIKKDDGTIQFIQTKDGTLTLADSHTGEWYHNSAGAYRESFENYAKPAVQLLETIKGNRLKSIKILDVCFGLGYNTFSFLNYLIERNILVDTVSVTAIENDASLMEAISKVICQDCYKGLLERQFVDKESNLAFSNLFQSEFLDSQSNSQSLWGEFRPRKNASIGKLEFEIVFDDLRSVVPSICKDGKNTFDLIFHDPFSPAKFPQFWTKDLFGLYRQLLVDSDGMLFTYSVATAVRSALIQSGFSIYRTASVGAKSGGTLAVSNLPPIEECSMNNCIPKSLDEILAIEKTPDEIVFVLDDLEVSRILTSSGIPYRDPDLNLDRINIQKNREIEINEFKIRAAKS